MCAPALAIGLIGAGVQAAGQMQAASAQAQAAEYNAAVHRNNAIAESQSAAYEASSTQRRLERVVSRQVVGYAKAGVAPTGTPSAVMGDSVREGSMDVLATLYAGNVAAGRENAAAKLSDMEASSARIGGAIGAFGTLLGGFGNAVRYV
jgi:hypothetical protein